MYFIYKSHELFRSVGYVIRAGVNKIVYLYFLAVSVSVYGMVFFKKYDITLREVD